MPVIYVRSTDGSDSDDGSTWALAKATLAGAATAASAGDVIYVSHSHAESSGSPQTITLAGTIASPVHVVCGNDAAEPPTTAATTAIVETTNGDINLQGAGYYYGIEFRSGSGGAVAGDIYIQFNTTTAQQTVFEECLFNIASSSNTQYIRTNVSVEPQRLVWKNCDVQFSHINQRLNIINLAFHWDGGAVRSDTAITHLLDFDNPNGRGPSAKISGVDFSNCDSALTFFGAIDGNLQASLRDCKLPASWSGTLARDTLEPGARLEMHNCSGSDTNYAIRIEDWVGTLVDETTIVRSSGASDGTTPIAWKITTNADADAFVNVFVSGEVAIWNETVGSAVTVTAHVVHDSVGGGTSGDLTDKECWLEVMVLDTSGFPLGGWHSDRAADYLDAAADQTDDSATTWTTTGLTTPVKQKLSVSVTPQEKGYIIARVCLAKPNTTVYVCPKIELS